MRPLKMPTILIRRRSAVPAPEANDSRAGVAKDESSRRAERQSVSPDDVDRTWVPVLDHF